MEGLVIMTLEEVKDMILFCRLNGVTQLKVGDVAMVVEPVQPEISPDARMPHPFDKE